jgi:PAS domain S-box-containing protein
MKVKISAAHLSPQLSLGYVWIASLLAPLTVAVLNVGLGRHGVVNVSFGGIEGHFHLVAALVLYLITALVMSKIVSDAASRRREAFRRSLIIDECNHHIRNALQSMAGTAYLNGSDQQISAAVSRIERTLTDLLPRLQDTGDGQQTVGDAPVPGPLDTYEAQLNRLYDHVQAGVVKLSGDGHILRANPAMCTMLGYTAEEFRRKTCQEITEASDYAEESPLIRDLFGRKLNGYSCNKQYIHKYGYPVRVKVFSTLLNTGRRTSRILIVDKPSETVSAK